MLLCNIHLSKIVAITTVFHLPFHRVGLYVMLLICPVCCKNETSSHINIFGSVFLSLLCRSWERLHLHVDKNQTNRAKTLEQDIGTWFLLPSLCIGGNSLRLLRPLSSAQPGNKSPPGPNGTWCKGDW